MTSLIKNERKVFSKSCRVFICNYFYNNTRAFSLLKWMENVMVKLQQYVEEIYIPHLEIPPDAFGLPHFKLYHKREQENVTYEVFIFFGNVNTLTSEMIMEYNKLVFLRKDLSLNEKCVTCCWAIVEGTALHFGLSSQLINRFFDEFWVGSEFVKDIVSKYNIPSIVVPNGIDHHVFKPNIGLLDNNACKVLCVATDVPRKNLDLLVEAFTNYITENKTSDDFYLILKTNTDRFKNTHSNIIVIDYTISDEQMVVLINQCHFAINVASSEGFCLPLCEALACRKMCIAPYYGGIRTFLKESHVIPIPYSLVPVPKGIHDCFGNWLSFNVIDVVNALKIAYRMYKTKNIKVTVLDPSFFWENIVRSVIKI